MPAARTSTPVVVGRMLDGRAVQITISGSRIGSVVEITTRSTDADLPWVAPGLIDVQVNGFAGYDVNAADPAPESIHGLATELGRRGITGWCPTVTTCSQSEALARIEAVVAAVDTDPGTAHSVLGIHLEGPHLSPLAGARGVHPPEHIRAPDVTELHQLVDAARGLVRIVTLSPEWQGAPEFIRAVAAAGAVPAIGHTSATPEQIDGAAAAGARLSTHLGNGIPAMLPRHPNVIWSQLAADGMSASFIADGHHLPACALRSMIRAKTTRRSILISDSTAVGGLPPGRYDTPVGGAVELTDDGRLGLAGTPYLAGSAVSLTDCVGRAVHLAGITPAEAMEMATRHPADLIGSPDRGRVETGSAADIVVFRFAGATAANARPVGLHRQTVPAAGQAGGSGTVALVIDDVIRAGRSARTQR